MCDHKAHITQQFISQCIEDKWDPHKKKLWMNQ